MTAPLVVCVDDDPSVVRTIVRLLKREHIEVMSTTEPEEALEWVLANDVAVLVSDYDMPGMNGVQLASRARQLRPATVRILISGRLELDTVLASVNDGEVFRVMAKPFDPDAVVATVHRGIAYHRELAAIAGDRELAQRRAQVAAALEEQFPTISAPARGYDGAYLVQRPAEPLAGLEALLALRR